MTERLLPDDVERPVGEEWVAAYFGVTRPAVQKWRMRGIGPPFFRIGRRVFYKPSEVIAWTNDRQRERSTASLLMFPS